MNRMHSIKRLDITTLDKTHRLSPEPPGISGLVCQGCGSPGSNRWISKYSRFLITPDNFKSFKPDDQKTEIPYSFCPDCCYFHAGISDLIVPYHLYSLTFMLKAIRAYVHRGRRTVAEVCASLRIAISTLYRWLHTFKRDFALLSSMRRRPPASGIPIDDFLEQGFSPEHFSRHAGYSFMQENRKTHARLVKPAASK